MMQCGLCNFIIRTQHKPQIALHYMVWCIVHCYLRYGAVHVSNLSFSLPMDRLPLLCLF